MSLCLPRELDLSLSLRGVHACVQGAVASSDGPEHVCWPAHEFWVYGEGERCASSPRSLSPSISLPSSLSFSLPLPPSLPLSGGGGGGGRERGGEGDGKGEGEGELEGEGEVTWDGRWGSAWRLRSRPNESECFTLRMG
eukprot:scaffold83273_cov30-Tisochrysis_lutea.AAC.1